MKPWTFILFSIVVVALLLDGVSGAPRGGRGGGGRSGGGRGSSRGSSSSKKGSGGSRFFSKPRIAKSTPITPKRFSSPVIVKQTKLGSRAKLFTRVVAGHLVTRYLLNNAPVYRGGFPNHGSYVSIPENRAVRLSSETVRLLDSNGKPCLGNSSQERNLKGGIENNLIELNTTVNYTSSGNVTTYHGVNSTVALEDIKEQTFTVTTRARYNVRVVNETEHCTQVEKQVNGSMVQLYKFNPLGASAIRINVELPLTSFALFGIFNNFFKCG